MDKQERKVPRLRFPGFTDDWEQRKCGELCSITTGKLDANAAVAGGDYKFFTCAREDSQIDTYAFDGPSIIIAGNGDVGHTKYYDGKFNAYQRTYVLQNFRIFDRYLKVVIDKHLPSKIIEETLGSSMPYIKLGTLTELDIPVPDIDEQKSIGEFFVLIDTLITLHQRKLETIRKLKKCMLQKMFPKNGEVFPEVRFPGFTDAWEQRKLGELYIERNERGNDSLQMLSVSIHTGVSDGALDEETLGKFVKRSEDKSKYKHVYAGDLVFNMMRAWQGAIGVAKNEGMISPAYISAIPNNEVYPLFMDYALRRDSAISEINNLSYGVTDFRKRLYWDSFVKVGCIIPSVDEQRKIYDYFKSLDNLITLHQRKCDEIKELKKCLLQQMFV